MDDFEELNDVDNDKLQEIIDEFKGINSLYEDVIDEIIEDSEGYDGETELERIIARCSDIGEHGCVSGMVTSLIYYSDTTAFFDKYWEEIYDFLDDELSAGINVYDMLKSHVPEVEIFMQSDQSKNWIVWYVYEEIAYYFGERLEEIK